MKDEYIRKKEIFDALEKVASFFPYKIPGNADTYDKYNEAWNDAIGRAEMEIESIEPADVVTMVRCKDCRYHALFDTCSHPDGMKHAPDNGFCYVGKPREE